MSGSSQKIPGRKAVSGGAGVDDNMIIWLNIISIGLELASIISQSQGCNAEYRYILIVEQWGINLGPFWCLVCWAGCRPRLSELGLMARSSDTSPQYTTPGTGTAGFPREERRGEGPLAGNTRHTLPSLPHILKWRDPVARPGSISSNKINSLVADTVQNGNGLKNGQRLNDLLRLGLVFHKAK